MSVSSAFIQTLLQRCRVQKARLALPEGDDPRVVEASKRLLEEDVLSELWVYGDLEAMKQSFKDVSDSRLKLINKHDKDLALQTKRHFEERAHSKGKTLSGEESSTVGLSVLNHAAMHLAENKVDAVVAGCVHTTADVIRATLKGVGLKAGIKTLSGSFVMARGSEVYLFGDCAVVADPNPDQLADIAAATAETFKLLIPDSAAKIAFLSFSTKGSAEHPRVSKIRDALSAFEAKKTGLLADGELQFDAAFVPDIGARKAKGSPVAGQANCFIFPDLDSGNIGYKIAQRLGGFDAYGPILQGGAKPYLDLSRGANAQDIMVSSLLALIKSQ